MPGRSHLACPSADLVCRRSPSALEQKKSSSKRAKKSSASTKKTTKAKPAAKKETSASVKRQEAAVKKEIKLTQQQIEANEKEVTENLAVLSNLAHDIDVQKGKISSLEAQERSLLNSIASHEQQIKEGEANLASLRERYVSAVKKMRVARRRFPRWPLSSPQRAFIRHGGA